MTISDNNQAYTAKKFQIFKFLIELIKKLKFPLNILQQSSYYWQTFFLFNKYHKNESYAYDIALASLFASCKRQDYVKKLRDIQAAGNEILSHKLNEAQAEKQRKKILNIETFMLQLTCFEFRLVTVEELLIKFGKLVSLDQEIMYVAWLLCNDSYLSEAVLKYPPHGVAASCLILANEIARYLEWPNVLSLEKIGRHDAFGTEKSFCNQIVRDLMQYYMDYHRIGISYFLNYLSDEKKIASSAFIDCLIDIKLQCFKETPIEPPLKKQRNQDYKDDPFFKERDFSSLHSGNMRFTYDKAEFVKELRLM